MAFLGQITQCFPGLSGFHPSPLPVTTITSMCGSLRHFTVSSVGEGPSEEIFLVLPPLALPSSTRQRSEIQALKGVLKIFAAGSKAATIVQ